ncbi:methytransferase partner Trm112 [Chloroflexota bacterium]
MKKELLKVLACPICKGDLMLDVKEEKGEEIVCGSLTCAPCQLSYPINEGIPNLLPPELKPLS